ncbi:MAG: hypothetical protein AAGL49_12180 [Pseudomonadota bacterium]
MTYASVSRLGLASLFALAATGCVSGLDPQIAESPKYSSGYADGCETAHQRTQAFSRKTTRDESLFESDKGYRTGWRQGYSACSDQDPIAAPDEFFGDERRP